MPIIPAASRDAVTPPPDTPDTDRFDTSGAGDLWYYGGHGDRHGPFSERELRDLVGSGAVPPGTLVSHGTEGVWVPADDAFGDRPGDAAPEVPRETPVGVQAGRRSVAKWVAIGAALVSTTWAVVTTAAHAEFDLAGGVVFILVPAVVGALGALRSFRGQRFARSITGLGAGFLLFGVLAEGEGAVPALALLTQIAGVVLAGRGGAPAGGALVTALGPRLTPAFFALVVVAAVGVTGLDGYLERGRRAGAAVDDLLGGLARVDRGGLEEALSVGGSAATLLRVDGAPKRLRYAVGPGALGHVEALAAAYGAYTEVTDNEAAADHRALVREFEAAERRFRDMERATEQLGRSYLTVIDRIGPDVGRYTEYEAKELGSGYRDRVVLLGDPDDLDPYVGRMVSAVVRPVGTRSFGAQGDYPVYEYHGPADEYVDLLGQNRRDLAEVERNLRESGSVVEAAEREAEDEFHREAGPHIEALRRAASGRPSAP